MQYSSNLIQDTEETLIELMKRNIPVLKDEPEDRFIKEAPEEKYFDDLAVSLHLLESKEESKMKKRDAEEKEKYLPLVLYYMITPLTLNSDNGKFLNQLIRTTLKNNKSIDQEIFKGNLVKSGNTNMMIEVYEPQKEEIDRLRSRFGGKVLSLALFYKVYPLYIPLFDSCITEGKKG